MAGSSELFTARNAAAVNLGADTGGLTGVRSVYVGVTGDVKMDLIDGGTVTFKAHPVGYLLAQPSKIYSTANGTTATDLVLLY
jgi:hypothetical protein